LERKESDVGTEALVMMPALLGSWLTMC
jgi:hypothetical protein